MSSDEIGTRPNCGDMSAYTDSLYLDDNGRCTCTNHAPNELAQSIRHNPSATYHPTTLGTWEEFTALAVRAEGLDCEQCTNAQAA